MGILSDLKSLIENVKLSNLIQVNSHNDNRQVHIHVNIPENGELPASALKKVTEQVQKVISGDEEGFLATTTDSAQTLELIKDYEKSDNDEESRKFIKVNLPVKDRNLWMSALILRQQFKENDNDTVERLKREMMRSSPTKGGNIANLCSAGYLESHIIPLHTYLVGERKNEALFLEIYTTIVSEFPFAVFVSHTKNDEKIKEEIMKKIDIVKKYGWKKVSVHGIGEDNVKKIKRVSFDVEEEKKEEIESTDVNSHESSGRIITIGFNLR